MKRVLFALALFTSPALAAPPCWPDVSMPVTLEAVSSTSTPKVGEVIYAASTIGLVWGYTCTKADGTSHKVVAGGPWSAFPADWVRIVDTAMRGTDAERAALWDQYATSTTIDSRLATDVAAIASKLPTPVAEVWKVALNGTYTTRPAYPYVNGVRGTTSVARATVGADCNCAAKSVEGTSTYCGVNGRLDQVALCRKQ